MYVQYLNTGVAGEILPQLADIDIQAASARQVFVAPNAAQGGVSLDDALVSLTKIAEQFTFDRRQFLDLAPPGKRAGVCIEMVLPDVKIVGFGQGGSFGAGSRAPQDHLDAEVQFLHVKGFGHVIVGTKRQPLYAFIFFGLAGKEKKGRVGRECPNFPGDRKTILKRHFYVEDAKVELSGAESLDAFFPGMAEGGLKTFSFQKFANEGTEGSIVVHEKQMWYCFHIGIVFMSVINDSSGKGSFLMDSCTI